MNQRIFLTISAAFLLQMAVSAQSKYMTRNAYVRFFSTTPVENIEAINNQTSSVFDATTGKIVFQVPIKGFQFEKALMQEHFNENYLESDKIPNATFNGEVKGMPALEEMKDKEVQVHLVGTLNIHGVDQPVDEVFTMTIVDGQLRLQGTFSVAPEDYKIAIPSAVSDKIAERIEVSVKAAYTQKS